MRWLQVITRWRPARGIQEAVEDAFGEWIGFEIPYGPGALARAASKFLNSIMGPRGSGVCGSGSGHAGGGCLRLVFVGDVNGGGGDCVELFDEGGVEGAVGDFVHAC